VTGQVVLGKEEFVEEIRGSVERGTEREQPSAREFSAKSAAVIVREVCRQFGVRENDISGKRIGRRNERAVAMEMLYRHGQLSQAAIGKALGGLDYVTVSRERKRLGERVQKDKRLAAAMGELEDVLRHK
jgi:chromosomal replication initiation ATPase DnaA